VKVLHQQTARLVVVNVLLDHLTVLCCLQWQIRLLGIAIMNTFICPKAEKNIQYKNANDEKLKAHNNSELLQTTGIQLQAACSSVTACIFAT
jgi:hypothetical protein